MSVVLTDEEFVLIYQSLHLSRYPEDMIELSLELNEQVLDLVDALPETAQLREQALAKIPALEEEYQAGGLTLQQKE